MAKVMISLPDDLLDQLDKEAERAGAAKGIATPSDPQTQSLYISLSVILVLAFSTVSVLEVPKNSPSDEQVRPPSFLNRGNLAVSSILKLSTTPPIPTVAIARIGLATVD